MTTCIRVISLVAMGLILPGLGLAQSDTGAADPFDGPTDVSTQLRSIDQRNSRRESLLPSPLKPVNERAVAWKKSFYQNTGIKFGFSTHTVYQYADEVKSGTDNDGVATDFDFVGTVDLVNAGTPTLGGIYWGVEGRWNYGTTGPQTIGLANIGAAGGSANSFEEYKDPTFILRNIYWKQGSVGAGWVYRIGKITTDAMLGTNRHLNPNGTFLSNAGTGLFVNSYADSGPGAAGALYFDEGRGYIGATIADANGVRDDFGELQKGDFHTAVELGYKIMPRSENASYSKLTVWHTDGTDDGTPVNGNTGSDGWGWSVLHEHELSDDGKTVAVARWGSSYDKAAIYDHQGALALLFYEPFGWFDSDVVGFQVNYVDPAGPGTRDETSFETFYRFPLFAGLDMTLAYQHINNPGNTREVDSSNVFSIRLVTSY
jgi:hypothetical protein